jgi:biopolymer transport protein ExbD
MTPLIDRVFILLIFFIVTTSFVREAGVDVRRPQAHTAQTLDKANVIVAVTAKGTVHVEGRVIDVRSVRAYMERFLAEFPDGSVVIAADEDSNTGLVIRVLDGCRLAGVRNVSVAARRP